MASVGERVSRSAPSRTSQAGASSVVAACSHVESLVGAVHGTTRGSLQSIQPHEIADDPRVVHGIPSHSG